MADQRAYRSYYANQLLRLYYAEEQVAGVVDTLVDEVAHTELKRVFEREKELLDRERLTVKRIYDQLGIRGDPRRAESFVEAAREAESAVEQLEGLEPSVRDLEIIAIFRQLTAQQESTIRALLTYAREMELADDLREFESMLQRETEIDARLHDLVCNRLFAGDRVEGPRLRGR